MKPENHAIRALERSLETAPPEIHGAICRVIFALNVVLLNQKDPVALALAKRGLAEDMAKLEAALKSDE